MMDAISKPYCAYGGCVSLWEARNPEVLLAGPSGTGKSRACLEKLNALAIKYPGIRGLIARKTRESLTQSALVTLERDVIAEGSASWWGNSEWRYPNGSKLITVGLNEPTRIMSSDFDVIYVQEATELSEEDWEYLTTRLRGQGMPYQQIIADCNPAGPNHWLKKRAESGKLRMVESRHEDNPVLYSGGQLTDFGAVYLSRLDSLTGVRYQRLRKGLWVAAEGMVYAEFDWNVHLVDRFKPPAHWPRLWAMDFGYTHPACWQAWAKDEEGRLYRFAELYHTGLLVEDIAERIRAWQARTGEGFPQAIICDHDAEGRATLEKHLGVGTVAADKSVSPGIQVVMKRLQAAEDGKPRLFLMRDSAIARDPKLLEAKQPTCTEEEFELYLWRDGVKDSEPVKANDHGMDALRYLAVFVDGGTSWSLEEIRRWGGLDASPEAPAPKPAQQTAAEQLTAAEEKRRAYEEEIREADKQRMRRLVGW